MSSPDSSAEKPAPAKNRLQRVAEMTMVIALAGMVIAVFVLAAFEGKHLGFDMVTSRLKGASRKRLFWLSQLLVAGCMVLLLIGSWKQVLAGMNSYSTVLGYPLALGAAAMLLMAVGLLAVVVLDLLRGGARSHPDDLPLE